MSLDRILLCTFILRAIGTDERYTISEMDGVKMAARDHGIPAWKGKGDRRDGRTARLDGARQRKGKTVRGRRASPGGRRVKWTGTYSNL